MGCGSSKSPTKLEMSNGGNSKPGRGEAGLKSKKANVEIKKNLKNRENDVLPADLPGSVPENEPMPAPVTFEIPAIDAESIIKKHPPKRLQKLEEQQIGVTEDRLLEKQTEAEERRQKLLRERVSSSRLSANRGGRRMRPKDSAILEQIEHEKTARSPAKKTASTDELEF